MVSRPFQLPAQKNRLLANQDAVNANRPLCGQKIETRLRGYLSQIEEMPKIVLPSDVSQENIEHSVTVSLHEEIERVPCWPCHRLDDDQSTYVPNKDGNGAACISDIGAEVIVATARQLLRQDEMLPAAR